jgi:hypothetical protein
MSYEIKYDTQKSNENYAKKSRPCRFWRSRKREA